MNKLNDSNPSPAFKVSKSIYRHWHLTIRTWGRCTLPGSFVTTALRNFEWFHYTLARYRGTRSRIDLTGKIKEDEMNNIIVGTFFFY